ncbi:MAG TPA: radical SAM family heme chaperone HemW [Stenotrophobium sp.]|jgi:oxygen-independent coproporphyrinogen-3 oxidase|nr:radical SAM family heme chaperone HemW [Stenotrophobium sp.]
MTPASTADLTPLSLYLHFPWCVRKCPYCDFNSHALRGEIPEDEYIAALLRDLDFELSSFADARPLASIFMGGGTPSLFSGRAITRLLEETARRLHFASDIEITLEANPGTVDEAHFTAYRAAGVNRLSIGIQSLNGAQLKALGRIHDPLQARHAVDVARRAGFDNLNLDLMYALPQQTLAEAEADIRSACALAPEHLSYYQLTLEPNTEFHARPPPLPEDDLAWAMQEQGQALLADHGYAQYEVSAYARPGRRCRHNLNYWQFGDYLGIGAGAHGKLSHAGGIVRRARQKHPRLYLDTAGTAASMQEQHTIPAADLPFEYTMNALRLNEGFELSDFVRCTSLPASTLAPALDQARQRGLIETHVDNIRASKHGRAFLNDLIELFLP